MINPAWVTVDEMIKVKKGGRQFLAEVTVRLSVHGKIGKGYRRYILIQRGYHCAT